MLVNHTARRSQKAFPAPFPRLVANVGIFNIKRSVKGIKTTDCQEFLPIDRARASTSPENGNAFAIFFIRLDLVMPKIEETPLKSCSSLTCLLPATARISKENLRSHGEY